MSTRVGRGRAGCIGVHKVCTGTLHILVPSSTSPPQQEDARQTTAASRGHPARPRPIKIAIDTSSSV
jgi:hypothetical protein